MTAEVYLEGKLVRMISKRMPMVTDLGLHLVDNLREIEGIWLRS